MESDLNDIWTMYFHTAHTTEWNKESFTLLGNVATVEEFWAVHKAVEHKLHEGMFFLMRESIFPLWEEKENRDGGYLSLKVLKASAAATWENMCCRLLGETLLHSDHQHAWDLVNGISISPKKSFCIIKVWLKTLDLTDPKCFLIQKPEFSELLFRPHAA